MQHQFLFSPSVFACGESTSLVRGRLAVVRNCSANLKSKRNKGGAVPLLYEDHLILFSSSRAVSVSNSPTPGWNLQVRAS